MNEISERGAALVEVYGERVLAEERALMDTYAVEPWNLAKLQRIEAQAELSEYVAALEHVAAEAARDAVRKRTFKLRDPIAERARRRRHA